MSRAGARLALVASLALACTGCGLTDKFGSGAKKKQLLASAAAQMAKQDAAGAVASLTEARALDPRDPDVLLRLGEAHLAAGQEDQAFLPLKEAAELPGGDGAQLPLGRLLRRRKAYAEAEPVLKKALAIEKEKGPVYVELGIAYWLSDRLGPAQETLEKAVADAPDSFTARFHLGEVYRKKDDLPKAREQLAAALRLEPDNPFAHFAYAEVLFAAGEVKQAGESYRRVIAANKPFPRLGRVFYQLAQIAYRGRDHKKAYGHLELAAHHGYDKALVAISEARIALAVRDVDRAEKALAKVAGQEAQHPPIAYLRGRVELARNRPGEAVKALEAAAALPLDPAEVQAALGSAYLAQLDQGPVDEARVDRAIGAFQKALKARAKSREALLGLAMLHIDYRVDLALAAANLKALIEAQPNDNEARAILAPVLARTGQLDAALEQLAALPPAPVDPRREFLRGAILLAQNQPQPAEESVVRGFSVQDRDLNGRLVLIAIYSRTQRVDKARTLLLRLMEANADSELDPAEELTYTAIAAVLGPPRPPDPFRSPSARLERRITQVTGELAAAKPEGRLELLRGLVGELCATVILKQMPAADADRHRAAIARLLGVR